MAFSIWFLCRLFRTCMTISLFFLYCRHPYPIIKSCTACWERWLAKPIKEKHVNVSVCPCLSTVMSVLCWFYLLSF